MQEQIGWRGLVARLKEEAPHYNKLIPQLPRLVHQALSAQVEQSPHQNNDLLKELIAEQRRTNRLIGFGVYFGGGLAVGIAVAQMLTRWYHFQWW